MYTRGPWIIDESNIIKDRHGNEIAIVVRYGVDIMPDGEDGPLKQWRDNAEVIKAAPDLLEACKEALLIKQMLDRGYRLQAMGESLRIDSYDDEASDCFDRVTAIIGKLNAAITKATGK